MMWHKCSQEMPGQEDDLFFNKELSVLFHPGFIVCFNHGDDEPFLARCFLKKGKFHLAEWCHYVNDEYTDECKDKYQERYWNDDICVTHWAILKWPNEYLDDM